MALEKVVTEDKIEVLESGHVQVRTKTAIVEDGVELSSGYHRHVIAPAMTTQMSRQRFRQSARQFKRTSHRLTQFKPEQSKFKE
jgi:hypothetical protein